MSSGRRHPEPPTATAVVLSVLKTSSRLLAELTPVFTGHGITATRFDILDALSRCPGGARPGDLRDMLHLPAQTITGVLDQLQAAGLVRRCPNPDDRRSTLVDLTPDGHAAIAKICPDLIAIEQDCLDGLSAAELRQLHGLLARIQDRISQRRPRTPEDPRPPRSGPVSRRRARGGQNAGGV